MIHQSPPPFAPLTSYPLVIWYPQGPVAQKVFEEPSSCRFPSRRKIITLNIFWERFFPFFGIFIPLLWLLLYLAPPSPPPYFPCYFYSEQSNWEPAWNERLNERKKKNWSRTILLSSILAFWSEEFFMKNRRWKLIIDDIFLIDVLLARQFESKYQLCIWKILSIQQMIPNLRNIGTSLFF